MGVSRREYARQRGVSESAVRKAIASGRISIEPDGSIDPEKANRQWVERTDPAMRRGRHARARPIAGDRPPPDLKPVPHAAIEAVRDTLAEAGAESEPGQASGGEVSFMRARLAREFLRVQLDKVRLGEKKNELVDRARAETLVFRLAREERDAWVNWPARVAALMAAELSAALGDGSEVAAALMQKVLEAHVRAHLEELAQPRIAL